MVRKKKKRKENRKKKEKQQKHLQQLGDGCGKVGALKEEGIRWKW